MNGDHTRENGSLGPNIVFVGLLFTHFCFQTLLKFMESDHSSQVHDQWIDVLTGNLIKIVVGLLNILDN